MDGRELDSCVPIKPDIAILGGGPGGYVAALMAAHRGASVVLVEKEWLGGTCLNVGCIPTKVLATAVEMMQQAKDSEAFGLEIPKVSLRLDKLMQRKRSTIENLVGGVEQLLKGRKVRVIRGVGRLAGPGVLEVDTQDGKLRVEAEKIILAPGSISARPPIEGLDLPGVMTSTEALDIEAVPSRLVVIGGGVIGMELGCIYHAMGSNVTIIEMTEGILPGAADEFLAKRLQVMLKRRGIAIHTSATVRSFEQNGDCLTVHVKASSDDLVLETEKVLVATGRWPNTQGMGFEEAGLEFAGRALAVDEHLATNLPGVWAIGDAIGGMMLAHKAMVDARVAVENAFGGKRKVDYRSVPSIIFTHPELAGVGLSEAQAKARGQAQGFDVKTTQFPFSANPRAQILGSAEGMVRLVCEQGSGRILGFHILGPRATDLIAEGALAVQMGLTAQDIAWTTHGHPTLPEAVLEAALGFTDDAIHAHSR